MNSTEEASDSDVSPPDLGRSEQRAPAYLAGSTPRRRSLVSLLCLFHMAAVIVFNLPQHTALGDLRAPFEWYARLSWLNQEWGMFTTIPHYAELHPVLLARYTDAADEIYGPMLPGLQGYPGDLRALYLVLHTLWAAGEYRPLADGYLQRACDAIAARSGKRPTSVLLRVDAQVLTRLVQARVTRKVGRHARQQSKAVKCR